MNNKILLVDDEPDITNLIEEVLRKDGFTNIAKANTGVSAIELCKKHSPDVIVLDIMLPDIDGIEVCKKIREFSYCSILFLSSKNDDVDKILGLSAGGDDYVIKPFSPKEIVFRIKAQLRRQQYQNTTLVDGKIIVSGNVSIDIDGYRVCKNNVDVALTSREFLLISYMAQNANKIISKERLYEQVWGEESVVCDNTIMVHMRHIREKIEDNPSIPQIIITVKGLGYKFMKR
ncbi:response regulator transcription factor [Aminipila sp.]|uniref:response regulator transcription factor n=1 Tax=Aminipila sp. TaxID=2060095 RepID=UPI0028A1BBE5|nr:response regulator transcription factor [Aminipila sp.]